MIRQINTNRVPIPSLVDCLKLCWPNRILALLKHLLLISLLLLAISKAGLAQKTDSTTYFLIEKHIDSCFMLQNSHRELALQQARMAAVLANKTQSWQQLAVANECQGLIYFYTGVFDSAQEFLTRAKQHYLRSKSLKGMASIHNNLGLLEQGKGNFTGAKALFKLALQADKHANDEAGKSYTINNLGTLYLHMGINDTALILFEQARRIALQLNDTMGIINYHTNLGLVLKDQKDYEAALTHFTKAAHLSKTLRDKGGELICLFNKGDISFEQGHYKQAKQVYFNCLEELEQFDDAEIRTHCLIAIGNVLQKETNLKESNDWYQKALKETEQYENNQLICNIFTKMGENFSLEADYAKALSYFRMSLGIAQKNGLLLEISENYKQMALVSAKYLSNDSASVYIEKYAESKYYSKPIQTQDTLSSATVDQYNDSQSVKPFSSTNLAFKLILILSLLFAGLALAPALLRRLTKKNDESSANSHNNEQ